MSGFLLSSANRTFAALEQTFGQAAPLVSAQQLVVAGITVQQTTAPSMRRDKSGSRSQSNWAGARRSTAFEVLSFVASQNTNGLPFCDPLFTAAMGGIVTQTGALSIASATGQTVTSVGAHGLSVGSAIAFTGEIRFVTGVSSAMTFQINAPFSTGLVQGSALAPAATYRLATTLPSLTLFDYWGVQGSFSRLLTGAVVEELEIDVTGDRHGMRFTGNAADLLDSAAFVTGTAGLSVFPQLPTQAPIDYAIVPGHLGQVWLGNPSSSTYTLTEARVRLQNNIALRDRELGSGVASGCVPGRRAVQVDLSLLAKDDDTTAGLYQIARDRGTMAVMLQLGQQNGQMMAVYLPSVMPEVPKYDDSGEWLTWHLANCRATGEADDELYLAFA